jgi:hypothetical protein
MTMKEEKKEIHLVFDGRYPVDGYVSRRRTSSLRHSKYNVLSIINIANDDD